MPIDASIPLQARGVTLDNPMETMGRMMSLKAMAGQQELQGLQLRQAQAAFDRDERVAAQAQQQERTLADLYKGSIGADGMVNRQQLLSGAAQQGLGSRIPVLQKQFADSDKSTADVAHTGAQTEELKWKTARSKIDASGAALSSLLQNPNTTHDDVIQTMVGLVQNGTVTPEQGQQAVRQLPGDPARLRQYLMQKGLEVMDAGKRMDMMTPKFEKIDNGGSIQMGTIDQLTGKFTPGNAIKKVATPDAMLSANTTMRGQNMTDSRERSIAATGMTYQQDQAGNMIALPTKGVPGGVIRGTPVMGADGKPLQGSKGELNDTQSKALLFGSRMLDANNTLKQMAVAGVQQPGLLKRAADATPVVGGALGTLANASQSAPQQRVEQAQRDFVNAVLRRESGAAISASEFENATKQYFPAMGDTEEVRRQKERNRAMSINGLMAEVPERRRTLPDVANGGKPSTSTVDSNQISFSVPGDIDALLRKHGGK